MTLSPYKKQTGRRSKLLDVEMMPRLRNALIAGNTIQNACVMAGISDKSYHRWIKEADMAPEGHALRVFRESVKEARAIAEHRMVLLIQEAAKTQWQAAAWWLERRHPEDWACVRRVTKGRGISQPSPSSKTSAQKAKPAKMAHAYQTQFFAGSAA